MIFILLIFTLLQFAIHFLLSMIRPDNTRLWITDSANTFNTHLYRKEIKTFTQVEDASPYVVNSPNHITRCINGDIPLGTDDDKRVGRKIRIRGIRFWFSILNIDTGFDNQMYRCILFLYHNVNSTSITFNAIVNADLSMTDYVYPQKDDAFTILKDISFVSTDNYESSIFMETLYTDITTIFNRSSGAGYENVTTNGIGYFILSSAIVQDPKPAVSFTIFYEDD